MIRTIENFTIYFWGLSVNIILRFLSSIICPIIEEWDYDFIVRIEISMVIDQPQEDMIFNFSICNYLSSNAIVTSTFYLLNHGCHLSVFLVLLSTTLISRAFERGFVFHYWWKLRQYYCLFGRGLKRVIICIRYACVIIYFRLEEVRFCWLVITISWNEGFCFKQSLCLFLSIW